MTSAEQSQAWKPRDTLANRLRLLRAELNLSQREFGEQCDIPPHQIQSIEDGKSPRSLDIKVKKIAMAFGVDRDWLMWGGELADPTTPIPPDGCPHQGSNLGPAD